MRIPAYLAVAQWVVLLFLGTLVVLMFRQLGRQLTAAQPPRELGPEAGSRAAALEYTRLADGKREFFQPGGGKAALLAFAEPTCPACEELVAALSAAGATGGLAGIEPLILISEPPSYLQISAPFRETRLPLGRIRSDAALAAYRVSATPLLVAVDGAGVVRAAGPAAGQPEIRAFVQACHPATATATLPVTPAGLAASGRPAVTAPGGEER